MAMSDRDMMDRIYEVLEQGLIDSEITLSRTSGMIYLSEGNLDWSLHLFLAQPANSEHT